MKKIFGQQENEGIYIYVRRHFISFLPFLLIVAIFAFGAVFLFAYTFLLANVSSDAYNLLLLSSSFVFISSLTIFMVAWIDFYFDIHIVTNHRVIDINQKGFFNRSISELSLENVEDATDRVSGILPNLFNYGNVEIQTAGTKPNFLFESVAFPREMAEIIIDLANQYREKPEGKNVPQCRFKRIIDGKLLYNLEDEKENIEVGNVNNFDLTKSEPENKQIKAQSNSSDKKIQKEAPVIKSEKEISGELTKDDLNRGGRIDF